MLFFVVIDDSRNDSLHEESNTAQTLSDKDNNMNSHRDHDNTVIILDEDEDETGGYNGVHAV